MAEIIDMKKHIKDLQYFYSNVFTVTVSPYDVTIDFGVKTPEQAKAKSDEFDKVARVSMSPTQAKTLLVILKELINSYEKDFGKIPLAPEFRGRYKAIYGDE